MGRTFGLVIVSIGLWLVFSLPTRAPAPNQGSTVAGALPESTPKPGGAMALSTPVMAEALTTAVRVPAGDSTGQARPSRTLGERNHAARSREIKSEPEAAIQRPPEPVALPPAAAHQVAAGTNRNFPSTVEQAIPKPIQISRHDVSSLGKPDIKNQATGTTGQNADASPGAPLVSGSTTLAPSAPANSPLAAIKVPRILEVVRRDLVASGHVSLATRPQTSGSSALSSVDQNKTIRAPSDRHLEKDILSVRAAANAPLKSKASTKVASATSDDSEKKQSQTKPVASPKDAKRNEVSKPFRPAPVNLAPRVAAFRHLPPPQRVRVAHVYSPPAYVGRIVARSAFPPAYYIPLSGSSRRSQFRGQVMWDSIRRGGM